MTEPTTGFKAVKKAVIAALQGGNYQHEARNDIDQKNLLATGAITAGEVITVLKKSNGLQYSCSRLHKDIDIDCHLIKTGSWYIKFYFIDPDTFFISVHQ